MKVSTTVTVNISDGASVTIDLARVPLTVEQREIATKLFSKVPEIPMVRDGANNPCEIGKCLASQYLSQDEFEKIRGVKVALASLARPKWVIIDFCIHPVVHDD